MPAPPPAHTSTLVVAAAAGAVAGAAALAWGVAHWQKRLAPHHDDVAATPGTWTCAQVAAWLHDNGVARPAVAVLMRYGVDGDALMRLTPQELYRMGVPLRDARMILAAIEDVRESAVLLSRASPRTASQRQSTPSPHAPETLSEPSSVAQFEAAWRALLRTCALPPSEASAAGQQQRLAVYTGALLESFQALSPSQQAAALTLVAAAEKVPLPPSPPSVAPPSGPAEDAAETPEQKLAPLHKMLDGFLEFLRSPDLDTVPQAELDEMGERVATQVKRIARVAEQLPPRLRAALTAKCDGVFAALASRTSSSGSARPPAAAATPPATSAGDVAGKARLMQALHHVLTAVEDPALRDLPAAQRVQTLTALAERTEAIEAAAAGTVAGVPADDEVLSMVRPILRVIRQAVLLSGEEAAALAQSSTTAAAAAAGDDAEKMVAVLLQTVQEIERTLHSDAFREAPAAVRRELCEVMQQRVTALTGCIESLPVAAQTTVRELLSNTSSVLGMVMATAEVGEAGEGDINAEGGGDGADDDEDDDGVDAVEGDEEVDDAEASADIDAYVHQLEKIFDFLTSDEMETATVERRREVAAKLLQRVAAIRARVERRETHGAVITELIVPLQELLDSMASAHTPSKEFLEVTAPLADVRSILFGERYQKLPYQEQLRIARTLVPRLQQLTAGFASLSEPERRAAEEIVRPINDELLRVVRPSAAAESTNGVQSVLERLHAVMSATQNAQLTTMSPAARVAWAVNTLTELDRVRHDCVALGAEGADVLPIIENLRTRVGGLVGSGPAAQEGVVEEEADGAGNGVGLSAGPLWVAVGEMMAELESADEAQAAVPPARLQRMLSVVREASYLAEMSAAQEATLLRFGALLRRQVESTVGTDANGEGLSGGGAPVDGEEADAGADAEALASLRQSLQALAEVAQDGAAPTAPELSAMAASAEDLIASADAAGLAWRQDAACASAVRSILGALQQSRDGAERVPGQSLEPSMVESVLQSSITAILANAPTRREDFAPYMRLLELTQPSTEQMTNRELLLLKTLQEAVVEAMRRLPSHAGAGGEAAAADAEGQDGTGDGEGGEGEEEDEDDDEEEDEGNEDASRVEAVLDALLQMSYKLREGTFSAEELDAFEQAQEDLERLLAREGVEAADAMEAVREQIRLQRSTLAEDDDDGAASEAEARASASDSAAPDAHAAGLERPSSDALHLETTHAFDEDDDDGVGSSGDGPSACTRSPSAPSNIARGSATSGAGGSHNGSSAH